MRRMMMIGVCLLVAGLGCTKKNGGIREVTGRVEGDFEEKHETLHAGEQLKVRLRMRSGTGYAWQVSGGLQSGIVSVEGQRNDPPGGTPMPGSKEWEEFLLKAEQVGEARVEFVYVRPWEQGVAPAKTFMLKVKVKG